MVRSLLGEVNPGGKLSETWPLAEEDVPCHRHYPAAGEHALYREGLYVGYRYYDTAAVPVRYPFGYGLSYTHFAYSDLTVEETGVSFTLTNEGDRDGAEVVQVYVSCPEGKVFRPRKELKGFSKVHLAAGEQRRAHIPLDDTAFRYFNVKTNRFEIESGCYTILVGASCADIRLAGTYTLSGTDAPLPYGPLPHYESGLVKEVSDDEFAVLLMLPLPQENQTTTMQPNDPLSHLQNVPTLPARLLHNVLLRMMEKGAKKNPPDLNVMFIYNMPPRAIAKLTGGRFSRQMVEDMLLALNGHFFRGMCRLLKNYRRSKRLSRAFLDTLKQQP